MIRRGYPKYINIADFDGLTAENQTADKNELFFNLGRSAIKFTLKVLTAYYQRPLKVIVQSFNCSTVVDAVLESGSTAFLTDVKLKDHSIDFNELITIKDPDVLILTHYQGIPNLQYPLIARYCREHKIFLMEDLCQTEYSRINDIEVGDFADVSIHAFSFDKPFSCFEGGSLLLNQVDQEIKELLIDEYNRQPMESVAAARLDLAVLKYLLIIYAGSSYSPQLNNMDLIKSLKKYCISEKFIPLLVGSPMVQKLYAASVKIKSLALRPEIAVIRLNSLKRSFILQQRTRFDGERNQRYVTVLEDWLVSNGYNLPEFPGASVNWNRYSVLDREGSIKQKLEELDIEAGNYNWPVSMNRLYRDVPRVVMENSYANTELLCEHIVNIPVWCDLTETLSAIKEDDKKQSVAITYKRKSVAK